LPGPDSVWRDSDGLLAGTPFNHFGAEIGMSGAALVAVDAAGAARVLTVGQ